eukprot:UN25798
MQSLCALLFHQVFLTFLHHSIQILPLLLKLTRLLISKLPQFDHFNLGLNPCLIRRHGVVHDLAHLVFLRFEYRFEACYKYHQTRRDPSANYQSSLGVSYCVPNASLNFTFALS